MTRKLQLHHTALFFLPLFFVLVAGQPINDTDLWWHLKVGEYIWQTGVIPLSDPFSFSNAGHEWITHEWLYEVIIFFLYKNAGLYGLIAGNLIFLGAAFMLLYRLTLLRSGRPFMSSVLVLVAAIMTSVFWVYRPHVLGYVCFLLFMYLLELYKKGYERVLMFLPLVMLFWVNAHGSYIMGLVLIGLYLISGFPFKPGKARVLHEPWPTRQAAQLLVCLTITFAMTLFNPNTYKMIIYPFFTIGNTNIIDQIREWASPDFHEPVFQIFLATVMAFLWMICTYEGRHRISDLILITVFSGLAFFAVRNIALFMFACIPIAGYYLTGLIKPREGGKQYYLLNWLLVGLCFAGIAAAWPKENRLANHYNKEVFPAGAVKYLTDHQITGKIFNDYNWGGYLLWFRFPENRMFIDGRTDIYADRVLPDYLKVVNLTPEWSRVLERYNPDLILIKDGAALNQALQYSKEWKPVYRDSLSVLYMKEAGD